MRQIIFFCCISSCVLADTYIDMQESHQIKVQLAPNETQVRLINLQSPSEYKCVIQDANVIRFDNNFPKASSIELAADGHKFTLKAEQHSAQFNSQQISMTWKKTSKHANHATMNCRVDVPQNQATTPVLVPKKKSSPTVAETKRPLSKADSFILALDAIEVSLKEAMNQSSEHRAATIKQSRGVLKQAQAYIKSKKFRKESALYLSYQRAKSAYLRLKEVNSHKKSESKANHPAKTSPTDKVVKNC